MKTIRNNTFETNSSSCHSITFNGYDRVENICDLIADASGQYCGSDNTCYDDDSGFPYDGGESHNEPEFKFDYAMVCLIEYFNRRARYEDKFEWFKTHPKHNIDTTKPIWESNVRNVELPEEVYNVLVDEYNNVRNNLVNVFDELGSKIDMRLPDVNELGYINNDKWKNDLISINGWIDHDSSCSQHESDPWYLAEMCFNPEKLFNFVFDEGCDIFICYAG